MSEQFEQFQEQVERKQGFIQKQETRFRRENDAHFEAETELKGQREQLSRLQMENQRDQQTIQHQKDRFDQLGVRSRENALELELLSEQEKQSRAQVGEKQQALQQVNRQFESLEEQYDARNREQVLRQCKLAELESSGDRLRSKQLDLLSRATTLRSAVIQLEEQEKQLESQSVRLENERNRQPGIAGAWPTPATRPAANTPMRKRACVSWPAGSKRSRPKSTGKGSSRFEPGSRWPRSGKTSARMSNGFSL